MSVARGIGLPLQIDQATRDKVFGYYARVLVEVDLSGPLPSSIMVELPDDGFMVDIVYENWPPKCSACRLIGHQLKDCRNRENKDELRGRSRSRKPKQIYKPVEKKDGNVFTSPQNIENLAQLNNSQSKLLIEQSNADAKIDDQENQTGTSLENVGIIASLQENIEMNDHSRVHDLHAARADINNDTLEIANDAENDDFNEVSSGELFGERTDANLNEKDNQEKPIDSTVRIIDESTASLEAEQGQHAKEVICHEIEDPNSPFLAELNQVTSILAKPNVDDDGFEIVLSKSQMKKLKSKKKNIEPAAL